LERTEFYIAVGLPLPTPLHACSLLLPATRPCTIFSQSSSKLLCNFDGFDGTQNKLNKSSIYPINVCPKKMEILSRTFNCQIGSMSFTYLELSLRLSKPRIHHFLPLIQRIERRPSCTSTFLSQAGRLELVNSVFSALPTFFMCTLKIPAATIKQIDAYRKHCLWRGNDVNSKNATSYMEHDYSAKKQQGLGVVRLETHNKTLLLKYLHKFFNNYDLPWVNLICNNYYRSDRLPSCSRIGSFWWRSLLSLVQNFKGLASPIIGNGRTIFFWDDLWNKGIPAQQYPELFSFACNSKLSIKEAKQKEHLFEIFQLPLSEQAYEQYLELNESCEQINIINAKDNWEFIWGSKIFSKKRLSGILWGISRFIAYSNRFRKINMNQSINFSIGYG
jgi:hypothetical protein